ncbi:hypothetical protein HYZ98_04555 [Candidatus Peregrinibacteria bacterium]|nr:hypothetical protein [Candidatus Peregrinibacteria bacterium]
METVQRHRLIQLMSAGFFLGLLFWGGYTLLYYIGVPVHIGVLLDGGAKDTVMNACGEGDRYLCRGLYGLLPFLTYTISRAAPFLWYGIICIGLYVIFLAWRWFETGRTQFVLTIAPWKALAAFVLSLWLLFTTLSFTDSGNHPFNWLFEPLPQVYTNVTESGLKALQDNMVSLENRGCLKLLGKTNHGARVFQYKQLCIQKSFWMIVVPQILFAIFLIFDLLVMGRWLLSSLRMPLLPPPLEGMASLGLGVGGWIAVIWFLAVVSQGTPVSLLSAPIAWTFLFALPIAAYRHSLYWLGALKKWRWDSTLQWSSMNMLIGWLLFSYLALNFLNVIRPFPIGWDDLGSYLNRPRLMVSYGHFIHSMSPFQWEYLTSLSYILFGYESVFGSTAAMVINWMAGLFATLTVLVFGHFFMGSSYAPLNGATVDRSGAGLLSALLYYSLPLVGHFSFADMKIDNAVFLMGALSALMLFAFLFDSAKEGSRRSWQLVLLAGIFGGLSFGMKPTAIMVLMALGAILLAVELHWLAFVGSVFFSFAVFAYMGQLYLKGITERIFGENLDVSKKGFAAVCAIAGIVFLFFAYWKRRKNIMPIVQLIGLFVGGFVLAVYPWLFHNNVQTGKKFPIIPAPILNAPNKLSPLLFFRVTVDNPAPREMTLPPDLAVDPNDPACQETGHKEELDRYWGFEKGWGHYLTLPWRTVMNLDSAGYYVTTMPALLLFPLLFLLPFFWWKNDAWIRWLGLGTLFMVLQWMFLANGILWYGIGMFLGLCIGLEFLTRRAPDIWSRVIVGMLITCSLFVSFANRFWQYEQQRNLLEFPFGKVSAHAMEERTIPHYATIARYVTQRHDQIPDRPYLYRVGTFIPYFIPKNFEVIGISDHQLDQFNCLHQERDPKITIARLKALGFNSIIFDTNTATIERTDGTLHKKVQMFVDFLNSPEAGLQPVINDPGRGVAFVLIP